MRLYRWLLRLCPAAFRREYGAAMEETFARRLAEAAGDGLWRRASLRCREIQGLVALAVSERWREVGQRQPERWLEHGRNRRRRGLMTGFGRELRHAARRLMRAPAFTLAAVLTLGLAIGANAALFTVVHRVVLNPLPYPESERLVDLNHAAPGVNSDSVQMTLGLYHHYQDRARTLEGVAIHNAGIEATLTGGGQPEPIRIVRASVTLASVLRVQPAPGRWFTQEEGVPDGPRAAVLSHRLWQRRYGADPGILGSTITLDGIPTPVVGIMPPGFVYPDPDVDVWIPQQTSNTRLVFDDFSYAGVARLRDGVTIDDARRELAGLVDALPSLYPNDPAASRLVTLARLTPTPRSLKEATTFGVTRALWILWAAMGIVLVVACANVANLFLVRSEARQREVAVRRALGAGRAGLARLFLAESAVLSAAGGLVGLGLAWGAVRLLVTMGPANLPRLEEVRLDGVVLTFALGLTLGAAVLFGATPLLRDAPLAAALHESGRSHTASRGRHRLRHVLMAGQVALAFVLLVSSGLLMRSFQELRCVDPGFDPASALTFRLGLPAGEYADRGRIVETHHAILDRLAALPGVAGASAATQLPLAGFTGYSSSMRVAGRVTAQDTIPPIVGFRAVAGGYFETMGMSVRRGRSLDRGDVERGDLVAVVDEALVKTYFPNEDPIGARVARGSGNVNTPWLTIVGVVADTPLRLADANPLPQLYMPLSVSGPSGLPGVSAAGPRIREMSYVVRSAGPPLAQLPAVREAVRDVDRNLALAQIVTLQDLFDRSSAQMAFTMVLLAIAATVALLLGVVGIYGVTSYIVTQRTGEIGVRLALGAAPASVAGAIVRQGGTVALAGLAVGLGVALAGSRLLESLLYGVGPRDPGVLAVTTLLLLVIALAACWVPARRAATLSPLDALRTE